MWAWGKILADWTELVNTRFPPYYRASFRRRLARLGIIGKVCDHASLPATIQDALFGNHSLICGDG